MAFYDLFLRAAAARKVLAPDLVLRVGGSPTSAAALQYLEDHRGTDQVVIDGGGRWRDHVAGASTYLRVSPSPLLENLASRLEKERDHAWTEAWAEAESATAAVLRDPTGSGLLEGQVLSAVVERLSPEANPMPFDGKRLIYGGFETIVDA